MFFICRVLCPLRCTAKPICANKQRIFVVKLYLREKGTESLGKTAMAYSFLPCYNSKRCVLAADRFEKENGLWNNFF